MIAAVETSVTSKATQHLRFPFALSTFRFLNEAFAVAWLCSFNFLVFERSFCRCMAVMSCHVLWGDVFVI